MSNATEVKLPATSWETLAGLRFFLAWVVTCCHLNWFIPGENKFIQPFIELGGKPAVIGFLLVSGYSIAASLHKSQEGFYRRRFLRVYPVYLFAVLFAILLESLLSGAVHAPKHDFISNGWLQDFGNLFLLQTFLFKTIEFNEPVWSLSVECFYYLLAPFFLRLKPKYLMILIAISSVAFALPRTNDFGILYSAFTKFNALLFLWPWLIGFIYFKYRSPILIFLFAALGLLLFQANPHIITEKLASLTYLLSFGLLIFAAYIHPPRFLRQPLGYLGDLSYPLYLVQYPCFIAGYALLGLRHPLLLLLFTLLITVLTYHLIDVYLKKRIIIPTLNRTKGYT